MSIIVHNIGVLYNTGGGAHCEVPNRFGLSSIIPNKNYIFFLFSGNIFDWLNFTRLRIFDFQLNFDLSPD